MCPDESALAPREPQVTPVNAGLPSRQAGGEQKAEASVSCTRASSELPASSHLLNQSVSALTHTGWPMAPSV